MSNNTKVFKRHITTIIHFLNLATHSSRSLQEAYLGVTLMFWLHMLGSGVNYYTDGIASVHVNTALELKIWNQKNPSLFLTKLSKQ